MEKFKKFCEIIETELNKIVEKGLTTSNLDTAYKLIEMYNKLKNNEYLDIKEGYYMAVLEEMQGGYSEGGYAMMDDDYSMRRGQRRDSRGRYSREDGMSYEGGQSMARGRGGNRGGNNRGRNQYSRDGSYAMDGGYSMYDRYMDSKQSYRANQSMDGKQRLMDSLEEYMDDFTEKIKEMHRDADTPEEREMISKFMSKLQNIR